MHAVFVSENTLSFSKGAVALKKKIEPPSKKLQNVGNPSLKTCLVKALKKAFKTFRKPFKKGLKQG